MVNSQPLPLSRNSWTGCVNNPPQMGCIFPELPASECDSMKTILLFSAVIGGTPGPVSLEVNHVEPAEEEVQLDDKAGKV